MEPTTLSVSHLYVHSEGRVTYCGIVAGWPSEVKIMAKVPAFDDRGVKTAYFISHEGRMPYRRLADIPGLGRALVGRGVPFETPLAGGKEGREALRR
jgi:hypothetical protein